METERLQGFPDGFTIVANWNGKGNPAVEPRYPAAAPGLPRRLHDREGVEASVFALRGRDEGNVPEVSEDGLVSSLRGPGGGSSHSHVFVKGKRAQTTEDDESWRDGDVSPTLNSFHVGDTRATTLVAPTMNSNQTGGWRYDPDQAESLVLGGQGADDALLPLGLDSHRYRTMGNAVCVPVAEWLGYRLAEAVR